MAGIIQNGQKQVIFIVVPYERNADGSEFAKKVPKRIQKQINK